MNGDDIFSIFFGMAIIYGAYKIMRSLIIWLYETLKIVGRIIMAIAVALITQIVTQSLFGIGITDFTWGSIGSALVMAFLFPNAGNSGTIA